MRKRVNNRCLSAWSASSRRAGPHSSAAEMRNTRLGSSGIVMGIVAMAIILGACGSSAPASTSTPSSSGGTIAASAPASPSLAGAWAITETITKNPAPASWIGAIGDVDLRTWLMTPACASGPCDVDVVSTHIGAAADTGIKLHFAFANGSYTNTYTYMRDCTPTAGPLVKGAWAITAVSSFAIAPDGSPAIRGTQHISATSSPAGTKAGCQAFDGVEYDLKGTPTSSAAGGSASGAPASASPAPQARPATAINPDKSCKLESTIRSRTATGKSSYTIVNLTASTLSVYWIDYKGKREHWFDLAPANHVTQPTFKSHPWVVTDEKGRCLRLFNAPVTITIK
jgi:hypothetical protein